MYNVLCSQGFMTFHGPNVRNIFVPEEPDEIVTLFNEHMGNAFLLLEGGADVTPSLYGETNTQSWCNIYRDVHETLLYKTAKAMDIPVLGICRGHQLMNVLEGGTLWQDLSTQRGRGHSGGHRLNLTGYPKFQELMQVYRVDDNTLDTSVVHVNSLHHQGLKDLAPAATPIGIHPDGLVEACVYPNGLSVQWHPELMNHLAFVPFMFEEFVRRV